MQSVVLHKRLDLRIEEQAMPSPGSGEVLVRIERGGICGSDLHYYNRGGFGTFQITEPMTLGHEIAGRVEALGAGVSWPRCRDYGRRQSGKPLRQVRVLPQRSADPLP